MALHFDKTRYGYRWMVETLNSMLRKRLSSFLRARTYWSQMREIMLRSHESTVDNILNRLMEESRYLGAEGIKCTNADAEVRRLHMKLADAQKKINLTC